MPAEVPARTRSRLTLLPRSSTVPLCTIQINTLPPPPQARLDFAGLLAGLPLMPK